MPRPNSTKREAASEALIELRQAMGKTQQEFSTYILNSAINTVARYETTHPPKGDALLRLARIARDAATTADNRAERATFERLRATFKDIYKQEMMSQLETA